MKRLREKPYPSVSEATKSEHIGMVKEIFATITGRYDFLNRLLSLRRDVAWRRFAVGEMRFFRTRRLLDVACGTGDVAVAAAARYPGIKVVGLDFIREMTAGARGKIDKAGFHGRIGLVRGDATRIPFSDDSFDAAVIAFGIRNIPDKIEALREMTRVVAPGGRVMVLEMTLPRLGPFRSMYLFYLEKILPRLARAFTLNPHAYIYLADSIKNFPLPGQFMILMEEAGLIEVKKYTLTMGITCLFSGVKAGGQGGIVDQKANNSSGLSIR